VSAGGVNVAADLTGWMPEVSAEQLLQWNPHVVILLSGVSVDEVLNDPKLASLSAVKARRVYALPESGWDFSSPRALFCIEWLASKLYPERFADVDIEAEADEFYQNVFGVDYTDPALADVGETRTITDMAGRQVEIPANVSRVVSLFSDITLSALVLGAEDKLVGVDSYAMEKENFARVYPVVQYLPAADAASAARAGGAVCGAGRVSQRHLRRQRAHRGATDAAGAVAWRLSLQTGSFH